LCEGVVKGVVRVDGVCTDMSCMTAGVACKLCPLAPHSCCLAG
jgi:hypothetical protein